MDETDFKKQRARDFATRLVKLRVQKNLNQAELAARASAYLSKNRSFSRGSISRYESGANIPGPSTLTALAKALDCEPGDLVSRSVLAPAQVPLSMQVDDNGDVNLALHRKVSADQFARIYAILQEKT